MEILTELRTLRDLIVGQNTRLAKLEEGMRLAEKGADKEWIKVEALEIRVEELRKQIELQKQRQSKTVASAAIGGSAGLGALIVEGIRYFLHLSN